MLTRIWLTSVTNFKKGIKRNKRRLSSLTKIWKQWAKKKTMSSQWWSKNMKLISRKRKRKSPPFNRPYRSTTISRLKEMNSKKISKSLLKTLRRRKKRRYLKWQRRNVRRSRLLRNFAKKCLCRLKKRKPIYWRWMTNNSRPQHASPFCKTISWPPNLNTSQNKQKIFSTKITRWKLKLKRSRER